MLAQALGMSECVACSLVCVPQIVVVFEFGNQGTSLARSFPEAAKRDSSLLQNKMGVVLVPTCLFRRKFLPSFVQYTYLGLSPSPYAYYANSNMSLRVRFPCLSLGRCSTFTAAASFLPSFRNVLEGFGSNVIKCWILLRTEAKRVCRNQIRRVIYLTCRAGCV